MAKAVEGEAPLWQREMNWETLAGAVESVPEPNLADSLQAVADEVPVVVGVDFVNVRVTGDDGRLYLVAVTGCTPTEIRSRAFRPLPAARVGRMVAAGEHDRVAASLGIEWVYVVWPTVAGQAVGAVALGCRTKRRPSDDDLARLESLAGRLAERLAAVDRRRAALRAAAVRLARRFPPQPWLPGGAVATLRPRERAILELYADGLSTADVAEALVISPHTVRTHVKLALRRLGVHSREEAAQLVRSEQLGQLL